MRTATLRRLSRLPVTLVVLVASCASWEETRREIVTPLNQLVHFDYPQALRGGDTARTTSLFAPELQEWAMQDLMDITGRFSRIDRSRCVIYDSAPPDDTGAVRTECVLRLDGISNGASFTWQQDRVITARSVAGEWKITGVETGHSISVPSATVFAEEAGARGLIAPNKSRGSLDRTGVFRTYLGSAGVAVGDADGDGADDLLMISGDRLRLFLNRDGQFENVTESSGIVTPDQGECRSGYFADIDNDGDQDLFVAMLEGENLLFENEGRGKFRSVPCSESGLVTTHGQTSSACFGDFDRDGDLDLVLANGNNVYLIDPDPERNARNGFADQYFRNNGDGTFVDATEEAGIGETGWSLACSVSDFDKDGDLDLYIGNDIGLDVLYANRGDGTFEDVTEDAGLTYPGASMSTDFGDVNGDGWPDLYVAGMASNSRWMLRQPGFPVPAPWPISWLFRGYVLDVMWQMFHGNRLYLNNRDGTFREESIASRSDWLGWAWSAVFLDYDNDGLLDIYCANGFLTGEDSADC